MLLLHSEINNDSFILTNSQSMFQFCKGMMITTSNEFKPAKKRRNKGDGGVRNSRKVIGSIGCRSCCWEY